jgi:hypothetical protein
VCTIYPDAYSFIDKLFVLPSSSTSTIRKLSTTFCADSCWHVLRLPNLQGQQAAIRHFLGTIKMASSHPAVRTLRLQPSYPSTCGSCNKRPRN